MSATNRGGEGTIAEVLAGEARWAVVEGDCLDVMATLPVRSIDLVATDPPYAISNEGLWHIGRSGKGKRRFDFFEGDADWSKMIATVCMATRWTLKLLAPRGSAYWWVGHREFGPVSGIYERAGFTTRPMAWAKAAPSPPPPGSGWPSGFELGIYAFRAGRVWNHDGRHPPPNNVFTLDSYRHGQPGKVDHPTQKPVELMLPLLRASSLDDAVVLDPFAGSGTTGVACLRLGRRVILIEKSEKYAALARERMRAESQGLTLRDARAGQLSLLG